MLSSKTKILVTGANGQLGMEFKDLAHQFPDIQFECVSKEELSVSDLPAIQQYFAEHNIYACINCAAYTAVDKAEAEQDSAYLINTTAVGYLATECRKKGILFIHISTDYAFDGDAAIPYTEEATTHPMSVYGASKLAGEKLALENNPASVIIRTSWVYSHHGKNFVKTMIRLMKEKASIGVVDDQFGCPTYAADLAAAIMHIITKYDTPAPGIYHYCNAGMISWFEFALAIKEMIKSNCLVNPIPTSGYPTTAKRPAYSVLDTTKIRSAFQLSIPHWKDSLEKCIFILEDKAP